ncbi:MAG: hydroxysqualene dehydroxylase HpnE [Acidobacteria bacterium]|nr:hydroxysqualene dehydroxylase HpnE [Acidobacteriota bacterium]
MNPDAIVVGAGFAGLSAATALAERGARVLVLEARPTLGGRATAFTDPSTGERVDNGQHVLFGCYDETFRFLRRIGAESNVRLQSRLAVDIIDREGHWSRLACPALPSPFHLLVGILSWKALGWRDRMAALGMRGAIRGPGRSPSPGDAETVRQWLLRYGQTPRLIEVLWEPLAVAALNQSIDSAAAASFLSVLERMFSGGPRAAALALPLKPLDELYALPARDYIERHGGSVRTGAVASIECAADGSTAGHPALQVAVRAERMTARSVICAAPWHALSDVFPGRPVALQPILEAAANTAASPIVTVNLWFDRVVTERTLVGLPGRTLQWVFDKRAVFGEQASHLSLVSSGAEEVVSRSNEALVALAVKEVGDALPLARSASLVRGVVVREKRASFSVAPGQPPRPAATTGVPGLFLAGDWIDTGLPATIEGAVVSGHMAASLAAPEGP